jgi:hypothetical protein
METNFTNRWEIKLFKEFREAEDEANNAPNKLTMAQLEAELVASGLPKRKSKEKKEDLISRVMEARGIVPSEESIDNQDKQMPVVELPALPDADHIPVPSDVLSFVRDDPISLRILKEHPLLALNSELSKEVEEFASTGQRGAELDNYISREFRAISTNTHVVEGSFSVQDTIMFKKGKMTAEHISGESRYKINEMAPLRKKAYNPADKMKKNNHSVKPTTTGIRSLVDNLSSGFHSDQRIQVATEIVRKRKQNKEGEKKNIYIEKANAVVRKRTKTKRKIKIFDPHTEALAMEVPVPIGTKQKMLVKPKRYEYVDTLERILKMRKEWPQKEWTLSNAAFFPPAFRKLTFQVLLLNLRWKLPFDLLCIIIYWLRWSCTEKDLLAFTSPSDRGNLRLN